MAREERPKISRREFLKGTLGGLAGFAGLSLIPGPDRLRDENSDWEDFEFEEVPLNERFSEVMARVTPLTFDSQGNLTRQERISEEDDGLVTIMPTNWNLARHEQMESVELLIVHFDGALRYRVNGQERTAINTLWGLNGNDYDGDGLGASSHWCIDNFPIKKQEGKERGYGVLQTQEGSGDLMRPFKGKHVFVGGYYENGEPIDDRRKVTSERFERFEINSRLKPLVERKEMDFDAYTVGFEQIGTKFDEGFPDRNQPPVQQTANALSLTLACMEQFDLSPWDVVGHDEVQYKGDPGTMFMGTLRFLIGVAAIKGMVRKDLVFSRHKKEVDYFKTLGEYTKLVDRYGKFEIWKDYIGYDDLIAYLGRKAVLEKKLIELLVQSGRLFR